MALCEFRLDKAAPTPNDAVPRGDNECESADAMLQLCPV